MNIFYDFDLFGDSSIDTHLVELLIALKNGLINHLEFLKEEIENEPNGIIFIRTTKEECGIGNVGFNMELSAKIKQATLTFDFESIIRSIVKKDLN